MRFRVSSLAPGQANIARAWVEFRLLPAPLFQRATIRHAAAPIVCLADFLVPGAREG